MSGERNAAALDDLVSQLPEDLFAPGSGEIGILAWLGDQPVSFRVEDGWAVTEDDLVVGRVADGFLYEPTAGKEVTLFGARILGGAVIADPNRLWPRRIPYECAPSLSNLVGTAVSQWNQQVAGLVPLEAKTPQDKDFVSFVLGQTNKSKVGRMSGNQKIHVYPATATRKVLHEIGHAAGFLHEHNRHDREDYIEILWDNLPPGKRKLFSRYQQPVTKLPPYDFDSIMHYRPTDGYGWGPTFRVKDEGQAYYQEKYNKPLDFTSEELSPSDLATLKALYGP